MQSSSCISDGTHGEQKYTNLCTHTRFREHEKYVIISGFVALCFNFSVHARKYVACISRHR